MLNRAKHDCAIGLQKARQRLAKEPEFHSVLCSGPPVAAAGCRPITCWLLVSGMLLLYSFRLTFAL